MGEGRSPFVHRSESTGDWHLLRTFRNTHINLGAGERLCQREPTGLD
jgi:hypothetical protein